MIGKGVKVKIVDQSALVTCGNLNRGKYYRKRFHCKNNGYTVDFHWDFHPEKRANHGKVSSGSGSMTEDKRKKIADKIKNLPACLDQNRVSESSDWVEVNHVLATQGEEGNALNDE